MMEFFDLMSVSHRYLELLDPCSPEKILELGKWLGLKEGVRVIDYGCGCAEPLALWAHHYGVTGVGVDVAPEFCDRAVKKLRARGLADRIEIVCSAGADYPVQEASFDVATCIGATFVFGGYRETVRALRKAVRARGRLGIGEAYWRTDAVPVEYAQRQPAIRAERELLDITREEGYELEYVIRASQDDWDRYSSGNWYGLLRWLEENPSHPDRQQVLDHYRRTQDDYVRYERSYVDWAMYVLSPGAASVR
jgi:protein-L-isoaspartate O-methyltransferase